MSRVNTGAEQRIRNIEENLKRGLPEAVRLPPHKRQMVIVGGGPSLKKQITQLRHRKAKRFEIWATNGTHDYLISKGIVPDYAVLYDAREENANFFQKPHKDVVYFIASHCHPAVFEALRGYKVFLWHGFEPGTQAAILNHSNSPEVWIVNGGSTVGLRLMIFGFGLGYRAIHLYGMDSCYENEAHHAYQQKMNDAEEIKSFHIKNRVFSCSQWMLIQAQDYQEQLQVLNSVGCRVFAHGEGLIPFIHQLMHIGENYASNQ